MISYIHIHVVFLLLIALFGVEICYPVTTIKYYTGQQLEKMFCCVLQIIGRVKADPDYMPRTSVSHVVLFS